MVHWGDFRVNQTLSDGEPGNAFENQAYGKIVGHDWGPPPSAATYVPKASDPRGIKNNNPGNIKKSSARWKGLASLDEMLDFQRSETVFCVFKAPQWGIRAMTKNLMSYQMRGLRTVAAMIGTWAPPSDDNPTTVYAQTVANRMGIAVDAEFDFSEYQRSRPMIEAIIRFENGKQPYVSGTIDLGMALGGIDP